MSIWNGERVSWLLFRSCPAFRAYCISFSDVFSAVKGQIDSGGIRVYGFPWLRSFYFRASFRTSLTGLVWPSAQVCRSWRVPTGVAVQ